MADDTSTDSDSSGSRPTTRSLTKEASKDLTQTVRRLSLQTNKFMENFNPETSARERRKLDRKLNTGTTKKTVGALYDENGAYTSDGLSLCDCLFPNCIGCFFPCPKCGSEKCGSECRVNRKFIYDSVEIEGCQSNFRNNHGK